MASRKVCIYKNCDNEKGRTLFRFPTEKSRFYAWVQLAGVELSGEVDTEDPRYLCDKHFLPNYISHQSRRKMLVHTAVPEKWKEDLEIDEEGEPKTFEIVSAKTPKPRKSSYEPRRLPANETSSTHLPTKRHWFEANKEPEFEEVEVEEQHPVESSQPEILYEEVILPPTKQKRSNIVVVKPKKEQNKSMIINYIQPSTTQNEETTFFLTEEGNITTGAPSKLQVKSPTKPKFNPPPTSSASLENYTEFIFGGEMYVQMPKRVFEAECERMKAEARAEVERLKEILVEIRSRTDFLITGEL